jgi:hypothetical protein
LNALKGRVGIYERITLDHIVFGVSGYSLFRLCLRV